MLIGLGKMFKNVASTLASTILGYVYTPSPGSGYYTTTVGFTGPGFLLLNGDGQLAYSENGTNWSAGINIEGDNWLPPVYLNNVYTIVSSSGQTATSTDGANWTLENNLQSYSWSNLVAGNGIVLSVSGEGKIGRYAPGTGTYWMQSYNFNQAGVHTLTFENNNFLLTLNNGQTATSTDGISWTTGDTISNLYIKPVWLGSYYVTINDSNTALTSVDGLSWTSQTALPSTKYWNGLTLGNNKIVSINADNRNTVYSTDGANWSSGNNLSYEDEFSQAVFGNNTFVTISVQGQIAYSTDGSTWTLGANLEGSGYTGGLKYLNNKFIAINFDGQISTSTDGINWTLEADLRNVKSDYNWYTTSKRISYGVISTLKETQISIGGQGSGETVEALGQVDVYTVPSGKLANINMITIENLSSNQITYDLGIVDTGTDLTSSNTLKWDEAIPANSTVTILDVVNPVSAGKTIYVFPSAVDQVQVKVYGTETSI